MGAGVKRGTLAPTGRGSHSGVDPRCPACREPARLHNAAGNVRADCECTVPYGGLNVPAASFPEAVVPTAASAAPAGRPAAVEAPRRTDPRPAGDALVLPPAAVGGDDADEEVAADPVATGAVTLLPEGVAADSSPTAAALDGLAAVIDAALSHAYFVAPRWYRPSCHDWPLDPGACRVCKAELQPVYLATVPREVTP